MPRRVVFPGIAAVQRGGCAGAQHIDQVHAVICGLCVRRDTPVFVWQGRVGTRSEQQPHHVHTSVQACASRHEWGVASAVGVGIGATPLQQANDVDFPAPGRYMQGPFTRDRADNVWTWAWDLDRNRPVGMCTFPRQNVDHVGIIGDGGSHDGRVEFPWRPSHGHAGLKRGVHCT